MLFSHPRIVISEQSVRLPDGRLITDYLQIEVSEHVVIIVRSSDGRFLLLRQYKHGPRAVGLTFPAGHIEPGEKPLWAARRELHEETGLRAAFWRYFGRFVINGNQGAGAAHLFLAESVVLSGEPAPDAAGDLEGKRRVAIGRRACRCSAGRAFSNRVARIRPWLCTQSETLAAGLMRFGRICRWSPCFECQSERLTWPRKAIYLNGLR